MMSSLGSATAKYGEFHHLDVVMRRPWQAYVAAQVGRIQEAEALIAQAPLDCYFCLRTRGRVAAIAGQTAAADHWFAEAVRQAPSLANADEARAKWRAAATMDLSLTDRAALRAHGV